MRIVSLLPSATEILCALGLQEQLVGVTHECDYPPGVAQVRKVTQTHIPLHASSAEIDALVRGEMETRGALYSLDQAALHEAAPDLIVSQTLCSVCAVDDREVQAALKTLQVAPQVLFLEPTRLTDVFENIEQVAAAAGIAARGKEVVLELTGRVQQVQERSTSQRSIVVLEWLDPPFSSGHWTPELAHLAGGHEVLAEAGQRSVQITWQQLQDADPDVLLVACCGFTIERTREELAPFLARPEVAGLRAVREKRAHLCDGSAYFSRPGPRLVDSLEIIAGAIDPEHNPLPASLHGQLQPLA